MLTTWTSLDVLDVMSLLALVLLDIRLKIIVGLKIECIITSANRWYSGFISRDLSFLRHIDAVETDHTPGTMAAI